MKKLFIEPNEITDKIRNNKGDGQFIYDRIKEINEKIPLQIGGLDLPIGDEVFFGVHEGNGNTRILSAVCKGYIVKTRFYEYDENGDVDVQCSPIYMDVDGNEYEFNGNVEIVTPFCSDRKDAEDSLEDFKADMGFYD